MYTRRDFLKQLGFAVTASGFAAKLFAQTASSPMPNFIFYITDDISPEMLGCYGNTAAKTPNIDNMASEGMVFDNAYLTTSSCSPSRCSILTGRYPHNTGAPELWTEMPADQFLFTEAFRDKGYYTALSGKNHMGDVIRGFDLISPGGGPGGQEDWVKILQNRPKDKPFFFWFASHDAHRPWQFTDEGTKYDPNDMTVPPFYYDGPLTRVDLTGHYHEVSRSDTYLGRLLAELKNQDILNNTYIVYCSDNGSPFPRSKTRLYDSGIKTPLIIRGPLIKPARSKSLVSSIDFAPTFLELAGLPKSRRIQGVSFTGVLTNPYASVRDYVFSERNWHDYQAHERMVRYSNWVYIKNAWPELRMKSIDSSIKEPAGRELWQQEEKGLLHPNQRDVFLQPRPAEELYDVQADPDQFTNLANSQTKHHKDILEHLRKVLAEWIDDTGDTVPTDPTRDQFNDEGAKISNRIHRELPGAKRNAPKINNPGPIRSE